MRIIAVVFSGIVGKTGAHFPLDVGGPAPSDPRLTDLGDLIHAIAMSDEVDLGPFILSVHRDRPFATSFISLTRDAEYIRRGISAVRFVGELGPIPAPGNIDLWFTAIAAQIRAPDTGLFEQVGDYIDFGEMSLGQDLAVFSAVGRFLALSIIQREPVDIPFRVMLYAKLLRQRLVLEDIQFDEPAVYEQLLRIRDMPADELPLQTITIGDEPIGVTVENRADLIDRKVNSFINPDYNDQIEAMAIGFNDIVPLRSLPGVFSASEVRDMVRGLILVPIPHPAPAHLPEVPHLDGAHGHVHGGGGHGFAAPSVAPVAAAAGAGYGYGGDGYYDGDDDVPGVWGPDGYPAGDDVPVVVPGSIEAKQANLLYQVRELGVGVKLNLVGVERAHAFANATGPLNGYNANIRAGIASVRFKGEIGEGSGVVRDWFSTVTSQIFDPANGLFHANEFADPEYWQITKGDYSKTQLPSYFAVGRFLALSIIEKNPIAAAFPIMFYAKLLGVDLTLEDIKDVESGLYRSFTEMLSFSKEDLDEMNAADDEPSIEIWGEFITVTNTNRAEAIHRKINSLLDPSTNDQFKSILEGFESVIPIGLIMMEEISAADLRRLIVGMPDLDVDDLAEHAELMEFNRESPQIGWLWKVLHSFTPAQRSDFLRFVTGTTQIPVGGFAGDKRIKIAMSHEDINNLPTSHTCDRQLHIPLYPSEDVLRAKLEMAIGMADAGMGFV